MGHVRHDRAFLQYVLSNAAITFYAGRNDRCSPAAARYSERFTQVTLRGLRGRNAAWLDDDECPAWILHALVTALCRIAGTEATRDGRSCELD